MSNTIPSEGSMANWEKFCGEIVGRERERDRENERFVQVCSFENIDKRLDYLKLLALVIYISLYI